VVFTGTPIPSGVQSVPVSGDHMMRYETPRLFAQAALNKILEEAEAEPATPEWASDIEDRGEGALFGMPPVVPSNSLDAMLR